MSLERNSYCYGLVPDADIVCNSIHLPNEDLWHQSMGHASYKYLSIVSKHELVLEIPKLSRVSNVVCGPCQLGKQTKANHPGIQTSATSRPLELLHLDLMGLTRTKSLGGKRYIVVVVDDFTRYTWVILLRSNFDALGHIEALYIVDKCIANFVSYSCYLSQVEPTKVEEALQDESWVEAMHDELLQFQRYDVWTLVLRSEGKNIISTKWIFRNKTDEEGNVIRNKAHLVASGYSQMEGVDYDETFVPVARMESIRILLVLACHLKFELYQMDIKTAFFLNRFLKEDVYVA